MGPLCGLWAGSLNLLHYFHVRRQQLPARASCYLFLSLKNPHHHLKSNMAEYKEHYLRAGFRSDLRIGSVTFSHIDVKIACWLYEDKGFTLWEVKEAAFRDLELREIACAITHGRMDRNRVSYHNRPSFLWDPEAIMLEEWRVGVQRFTEQ